MSYFTHTLKHSTLSTGSNWIHWKLEESKKKKENRNEMKKKIKILL